MLAIKNILCSTYIRLTYIRCKVIIGRNPIEANANTVAIQLPGNPVAYILHMLHPILGIPLASIGKLPSISKLPIEA